MKYQQVTSDCPTDFDDFDSLIGSHPPDPETRNAAPAGTGSGVGHDAANIGNGDTLNHRAESSETDDFDALLSPLDRTIDVAWFQGSRDTGIDRRRMSTRNLARAIEGERAATKDRLRAIKLASFGDRRTDDDATRALRNNDNVLAVSGVEIDHDSGEISLAEAERRIGAARLAALLVTTASHTDGDPHWRAFFPLSADASPDDRARIVARANGLFGGLLDQHATFTLSQCQYVGAVDGGEAIQATLIDGRGIDTADDLDAAALTKGARRTADGTVKPRAGTEADLLAAIARGESYHPAILSLAGKYALQDFSESDVVTRLVDAMESVPESARDKRWRDRVKSIPTTVRDVFEMDRPRREAELAETDAWVASLDVLPGKPKSAESVDGFPLTEDGVALAFAKRFRNDLRFCHTAGRWYRWEGTHWRREETKLAFDWARKTCRRLAAANPKSTAAKAMSRASSAGGVERFAQADRAFAVTADAWDRDGWLLGTPGGTVDLRTGAIRAASPDDMITRLTAAAPIPLVEFDPAQHCPRWLAFLQDATDGDGDAIRFLQQWAGYSLTGDTREEALLFVHGPGGSGKSTAINTIADAMGAYATNVATETITASKYDRHSTEIARLHGARLARASETEAGRAWAESRLKALTGGDTITARFMRCDDFEFKPAFKLTIIGNHAPRIVNVDEAMRRRFNVLPFTHPPRHADSSLKDALQAEWPAILSWALQGCLDWQSHGLTRPSVVVQATDAYFAEQDTFALWLEACCEVGKGFAATMADLSSSFRAFAFQAGDETPMGSKGFAQLMQTRGFQSIKDTLSIRGRGFAGLHLRNHFDDAWENQGG